MIVLGLNHCKLLCWPSCIIALTDRKSPYRTVARMCWHVYLVYFRLRPTSSSSKRR